MVVHHAHQTVKNHSPGDDNNDLSDAAATTAKNLVDVASRVGDDENEEDQDDAVGEGFDEMMDLAEKGQLVELTSPKKCKYNNKNNNQFCTIPGQCPITGALMRDPVVHPRDGESYEREAILQRDGDTDIVYYPNRALVEYLQTDDIERELDPNDNGKKGIFFCPITTCLMRDPVIDPDGNSYERGEILDWLKERGTSPMTREPLDPSQLYDNKTLFAVLFREIQKFDEANKGFNLKQNAEVEQWKEDVSSLNPVSLDELAEAARQRTASQQARPSNTPNIRPLEINNNNNNNALVLDEDNRFWGQGLTMSQWQLEEQQRQRQRSITATQNNKHRCCKRTVLFVLACCFLVMSVLIFRKYPMEIGFIFVVVSAVATLAWFEASRSNAFNRAL